MRDIGPDAGAGARLIVRHGSAVEQIAALAEQLQVDAVIASHDDDPAALRARRRGARRACSGSMRSFTPSKTI